MTISRIKEHELIMISIYDALIYVSMGKEFSVEEILEGVYEMEYYEVPIFSKEIVIKTLAHLNEIISTYQEKMPKWKFSRLNTLEQSILLMSFTHYKIVGNVDRKVIIDTAVRLSKKYLDKDDYKFVNAILDNVLWMK